MKPKMKTALLSTLSAALCGLCVWGAEPVIEIKAFQHPDRRGGLMLKVRRDGGDWQDVAGHNRVFAHSNLGNWPEKNLLDPVLFRDDDGSWHVYYKDRADEKAKDCHAVSWDKDNLTDWGRQNWVDNDRDRARLAKARAGDGVWRISPEELAKIGKSEWHEGGPWHFTLDQAKDDETRYGEAVRAARPHLRLAFEDKPAYPISQNLVGVFFEDINDSHEVYSTNHVGTYKGHGFRKDIGEALEALKPRFVRFPGGCIVHARDFKSMYHWKETVGPLAERKGKPNFNWGGFQDFALGYYEYFQLCEDLGADALPILPAGVTCPNPQIAMTEAELDQLVTDTLDLIDFAKGDPATSRWAKLRADMGHPKPFGLKYLGLGNEEDVNDYFERGFTRIYEAVRRKDPTIKVVGTAGPSCGGRDYEEGWRLGRKLKVDILDEHYYVGPGWYYGNQLFYDDYDRTGPKVYAGEYAAHKEGRVNDMETALALAVHLTNLERNGDIVEMASYAPLFAKKGHVRWSPDLIYFTDGELELTTDYWTQWIFGNYAGEKHVPHALEVVLPDGRTAVKARTAKDSPCLGKLNPDDSQRFYNRFSSSVVTTKDRTIVKLVNSTAFPMPLEADLAKLGVGEEGREATVVTLQGAFDAKDAKPVTTQEKISSRLTRILPPYSLTVLSFETERTPPPAPCGPVPSARQLRWQEMETYAFIHYSLNTYTDQEWGYGDEPLSLFNPKNLDCRQWVQVCKDAGMRGIILTAKHHCGFCLWPSAYTDYSVRNTPWKDGKGDVVKELADACREAGLAFAVYLSPWDRNHPDYGRPEYVTYFRNQLRELLTNYGDVFEVWFDGANGGDGWYGGKRETRRIDAKTYYAWPETYRMIRALQPGALIWNDGGDRGDLRWVGNEGGSVGETNWSLLDSTGDTPWYMLRFGKEDGDAWVPGETNTSIRPGWFYHETEDEHVKSLSKLMDTYYRSVGRNSTLLLNFPIAPDGRIHETDWKRGKAFARMVETVFRTDLAEGAKVTADNVRGNDARYAAAKAVDGDRATYWATDDGVKKAGLTVDFPQSTTFNRVLLEEPIALGQRVRRFALEVFADGVWQPLKDQLVDNGDGLTTIGRRRIICFPSVTATRLRFTVLDSKACPLISRLSVYNAPELTADIPDSGEKKCSAYQMFYSSPRSLVINLGAVRTIDTIRYLPPQGTKNGTVTHYKISVTTNWADWKTVAEGEFSNVVNNPIWQTVRFAPVKAATVSIEAKTLAEGDRLGFGDLDIVDAPAPLRNSVLWADVPDPSLCSDGTNYYMVSTTMHLVPGVPVMASDDLKTWKTVSYVLPRFEPEACRDGSGARSATARRRCS